MLDKLIKGLVVFIPIAFILEFLHADKNLLFLAALLAIIPLAKIMGESTEALAAHTSPRVGGFLNATFGNATELILAIVALTSGLTEMVKASVVGSVVSNLLLVLGLSMLSGGMRYKQQRFSQQGINFSITLLVLSVICLLIPTGFLNTTDTQKISGATMPLSEFIAVVMLAVYLAGLFFSFYTHRDIYGTEHDEVAHEGPQVSPVRAIATLAIATLLVAFMSEMLVKSVETVSHALGISEFFIGLIIIPIIGNAAEHSAAVMMAMKNKMDVAIEIAVGSSIQIILLVYPILILIGWATGNLMSVIFNRYELVALVASVIIVGKVASDGESNWFEGLLLCLVYTLIAAATFFLG